MKTKKIWILACVMLVALASCNNDNDIEMRLTHQQKETYGQNIAGEYTGQLIVTYTNKDSKVTIDEEGHRSIEAYRETLDNMHFDVSGYKMRHVFVQDFPVSLIARVVDADAALSQALANAAPVAVTASYDFGYNTDYSHINWAFTPNVIPLSLHYGGTDHHIRIEFNNNSQYYTFTQEALGQPEALRSIASQGINLQLEAIYDGSTLVQRFNSADDNYMHITFRMPG